MSKHEHCRCHEHEHEHEHEQSCCCHERERENEQGCGCGCGHDHGNDEEGRGAWIRLGAAFLLFSLGIAASFLKAPDFVLIALFAASYITAGIFVIKDALKGILRLEIFGESFLMSIASTGAFLIGEYAEACAVMLLFELGERLQSMAVSKSRRLIKAGIELRPKSVTLIRDGGETVAKPEDAHIGDIIIVKPGEKVACDGTVVFGGGDLDMSSLTGESMPVRRDVGDAVLAGSISIDGTMRIRVSEEYSNSTVSRILDMLEHARSKKSVAEGIVHRFAKIYTPIVCGISLAIALIPPHLGFGDFYTWLYRALCALAASCPCALVISVPLAFFAGLGTASRGGVLIKGANYLEALAKADTAVFDKTGTLTSGKFTYVGEENASDTEELHFALAVCERYSTHPIAAAVNERFGSLCDGMEITAAEAMAGMGVRAVYGGREYLLGNAALMQERGIEYKEATLFGSSVYAACGKRFLGSATFADTLKDDTKAAVNDLFDLGICDTVMLTGDKEEIAAEIAGALGIKKYHASLLPNDKAGLLSEIKAEGKNVIYVGDGINDAPVIALADVGIAMGGIGSEAAMEAADAVIMGESLVPLAAAVKISRRTMKTVRLNIVFSLAVKLIIVISSALGLSGLWVAVFGDVGVCLLAVLNSLRIMKKQ